MLSPFEGVHRNDILKRDVLPCASLRSVELRPGAEAIMAKWYEAANEASFKRVADGYVFQCPNPWIFARPRNYLVGEAQKPQIFAILGRWRLLLMAALLVGLAVPALLVVWIQIAPKHFLQLAAPALQFGIGWFAVILSIFLLLLMAPVFAVPQVYLHRALREPLANAPLTNERITMREQLPKTAVSVSGKVLALGIFGGVVMIVGASLSLVDAYFEDHFVRSLLFPFLPIVAFGGLLTFYFVYLIRLKAKLKRTAA
jgi:hypothetical protein